MQIRNLLAYVEENKNVDREENEFNTADSLKRILSKNLSETSFNGINEIFHTKDLFLKLIFTVCFLTSSGFLCYFTLKAFMEYFSYNVLTFNTVIADIPAECNQIDFFNDFKYFK
jgi:hypothetical protein